MPSSSDVFIVSAFSAADPAETLRQAIKESGVNPARVQDFIFGADDPASIGADELARETAIHCPLVTVSSSLRALFFAAQSILCEDADLVLVSGAQGGQSAALLLASPAAVGVYNLMPLARIDAFSLAGADAALKKAGLSHEDMEINLEGTCGALLAAQLVAELQERSAHWGMARIATMAMLVERL
jgi:acetyl-CoA acetyltransferase